ncbi:hypothetical protein MP228_007200 [Amoeboaphelidium protococcarum]|nr:hypothetical protein MP228_007200 [Amoeboaphelidium protococcarum]
MQRISKYAGAGLRTDGYQMRLAKLYTTSAVNLRNTRQIHQSSTRYTDIDLVKNGQIITNAEDIKNLDQQSFVKQVETNKISNEYASVALNRLHQLTFSKSISDKYCPSLEIVTRVFNDIPKKDIVSYNQLLDFMVLYERPHSELFSVFKRLRDDGMVVDKKTVFALTKGLCNQQRFDMATQIFDLVHKDQNIVSVGAADYLIKSLMDKASDDFVKREFRMDLSKNPHIISANRILESVLKSQNISLDLQLLHTIIYGHARLRDPQGCIKWLKIAHNLVQSQQIRQSSTRKYHSESALTHLYNSLLDCYRMSGDKLAMLNLLAIMKDSKQMRPNAYSYGVILKYLAQSHDRDANLNSITMEMQSLKIKPTIHLYNVLLWNFAIRGRVEKVEALIERLKSDGHEPDEKSFNSLIVARCARAGINGTSYRDVIRVLKQSDKSTKHQALLMKNAETYYQMLDKSMNPASKSLNYALLSMIRCKQFQDADSLMSQALSRHEQQQQLSRHNVKSSDDEQVADTNTFNMAILLRQHQSQSMHVYELYQTVRQLIKPDDGTYYLILKQLHNDSRHEEIGNVIMDMVNLRQKYGLYGSVVKDGSDLDYILQVIRRKYHAKLLNPALVEDIDWLRSGKVLAQDKWKPSGDASDSDQESLISPPKR